MKKGMLLVLVMIVISLSACGKKDVVNVGILFTLEGENQIEIFVGDEFVDAGFIALDSETDISEFVTINGVVDTTTAGTYFLEYVLDYNDNVRTALRTVTVLVVPLTDTEISVIIFNDLEMPSEVSEDFTLDVYDAVYTTTVNWSSNSVNIISSTGTVVRPEFGLGNASVIMTATITLNSVEFTREFTIVVLEAEPEFVALGTEIFISEYIEGSSYNKVIELYNPTGEDITLDGYSIALYSNGKLTTTAIFELDGIVILSGGTIVIANSQAAQAILDVADFTNSFVINFNGNDAIGLYKNDVLIDLFGEIGVDPGDDGFDVGDASTKDHTLVRISSVYGPNVTWDPSEWVAFDKDVFDKLGTHEIE